VFKSLNTGLVALATNALVFVLVALCTPRILPRGAAPQPAG
jgi:SSS family solute:Na+ symporter